MLKCLPNGDLYLGLLNILAAKGDSQFPTESVTVSFHLKQTWIRP